MGIITAYRLEENFQHNILSVIFDSDSFFYAISDINGKLQIAVKYVLEGNAETEIPAIIEKENLADHYYSSVNIFSKSHKFAFVPSSEYSYGDEEAFISNSFPMGFGEITVDQCSTERLHIIHSYDKFFDTALSSLKTESNFRHISLAYIESVNKDGVFVTVNEQMTIILVRKHGRFLFYNHFQATSAQDAFYFIMLAYDQLDISPKIDPISLNGVASFKEEIFELLKEYVHEVEFTKANFSNMNEADDIQDLYLASICE